MLAQWTDGCSTCRHDTSARRLFRQSVDEARTAADGIVAAGGVKTLLVWAHKEGTIGNSALVRFRAFGDGLGPFEMASSVLTLVAVPVNICMLGLGTYHIPLLLHQNAVQQTRLSASGYAARVILSARMTRRRQARTLTDEALVAAPDNVRVLRLRARLEADADNHDAAREVHSYHHPLQPAHLQQ